MASRRRKNTNPGEARPAIPEAPLPPEAPRDEDGSVATEGVEMDAEQVRRIGAIDAESVEINRAKATTRARRAAGEKRVTFNENNGLLKYDDILSEWPASQMMASIQRVSEGGGPPVNLRSVACQAIRSGAALYDHILRNFHQNAVAATYIVRLRAGTLDRGTCNINMPDTTVQQQPMPQIGMGVPMMQPPWMGGGYGYPPPGYPPPGYDHYPPPPQAAPPPAPAPAPAPPPAPAPAPQFQPQPMYVPPPPPTADPAAQAWMGAMHQQMQQLQQTLVEKLDQRGEMAQLLHRIEELSRQQHAPVQAPMPALQPAAQPPPGFGAPPQGFGSPYGMTNPYAGLAALPRPPGYPDYLPWPPNPMANPWGVPPPPPAPAPVAAAPAVPDQPVDPLDSVRRSVELVGSLASLMDRVRGVAPAVSEATASTAITPTKGPSVETVRVGDVDVAMNPETGAISWMHTLIGVAPKAFSFLEKISGEVAKTTRAHDVSQAIQSGRMPMHYAPVQPQPQQWQPPPQQFVPQPPAYIPPQQPAAQPRPVVVEPIPSPTNGTVSAPEAEDDEDESVKSLFS